MMTRGNLPEYALVVNIVLRHASRHRCSLWCIHVLCVVHSAWLCAHKTNFGACETFDANVRN